MRASEVFLRMLYPRRCLLCGQRMDIREDLSWCGRCRTEEFLPEGPRCPICSRPAERTGARCFGCREHDNRTAGRSTFLYQGAMRESIQKFKYAGMRDYARVYAAWMVQYDREWLEEQDRAVLVPVPVHPRRLRERGYNQAAELAHALGDKTGLPVWEGLARIKNTAPLKQQSAGSRRASLHGAFALTGEIPTGKILIVDDIYTSGSTVEECARLFREKGSDTGFWTISIRP